MKTLRLSALSDAQEPFSGVRGAHSQEIQEVDPDEVDLESANNVPEIDATLDESSGTDMTALAKLRETYNPSVVAKIMNYQSHLADRVDRKIAQGFATLFVTIVLQGFCKNLNIQFDEQELLDAIPNFPIGNYRNAADLLMNFLKSSNFQKLINTHIYTQLLGYVEGHPDFQAALPLELRKTALPEDLVRSGVQAKVLEIHAPIMDPALLATAYHPNVAQHVAAQFSAAQASTPSNSPDLQATLPVQGVRAVILPSASEFTQADQTSNAVAALAEEARRASALRSQRRAPPPVEQADQLKARLASAGNVGIVDSAKPDVTPASTSSQPISSKPTPSPFDAYAMGPYSIKGAQLAGFTGKTAVLLNPDDPNHVQGITMIERQMSKLLEAMPSDPIDALQTAIARSYAHTLRRTGANHSVGALGFPASRRKLEAAKAMATVDEINLQKALAQATQQEKERREQSFKPVSRAKLAGNLPQETSPEVKDLLQHAKTAKEYLSAALLLAAGYRADVGELEPFMALTKADQKAFEDHNQALDKEWANLQITIPKNVKDSEAQVLELKQAKAQIEQRRANLKPSFFRDRANLYYKLTLAGYHASDADTIHRLLDGIVSEQPQLFKDVDVKKAKAKVMELIAPSTPSAKLSVQSGAATEAPKERLQKTTKAAPLSDGEKYLQEKSPWTNWTKETVQKVEAKEKGFFGRLKEKAKSFFGFGSKK